MRRDQQGSRRGPREDPRREQQRSRRASRDAPRGGGSHRDKFLCKLLRHQNRFVQIDEDGTANVDDICATLGVDADVLMEIVDNSAHRGGGGLRFEIWGPKIRARSGHTVMVDVDLLGTPLEVLYGGHDHAAPAPPDAGGDADDEAVEEIAEEPLPEPASDEEDDYGDDEYYEDDGGR